MIPPAKTSLLISILFFFLCPVKSIAQATAAEIIVNINKIIRPIETLRPDSNFCDIDFLREILKDKEVISLGEVTHGTREVFAYKDRLVRFLVTNMGYKAIAFEGDFTAIENIDDYINNATDSLIFLAGSPLISTNRSMIEWLRRYNITANNSEKVHVFGLEARGFYNIISKVLAPAQNISIQDRVFLEKVKNTSYSEIKRADVARLKITINNLPKNKYTDLLRQVIDGYYETRIGFRDQYMAGNAIWVKERAADNKLIIWAHNGHVAKTELYKRPAMGTYLDRKYGSKYFVIATDFNQGNVNVRIVTAKNQSTSNFQSLYYPEVNSDKNYEYFFNQCKLKNFIVDIASAMKVPSLNSFFSKPRDMRMIGALSIPVNTELSISKNFDMLVFFDKTSSQS